MQQQLLQNKSPELNIQNQNQFSPSVAQPNSQKLLSIAQQKLQKNKSVFNIAVLSKQSLTKLNWFFTQNKHLDETLATQKSIAIDEVHNSEKFGLDVEDSKQNVLLNLLKLKADKTDQTNFHFTRKVAAVNVAHQNQRNYVDNTTTTSYEKLYEDENEEMYDYSNKNSKHNQTRKAKGNSNDMLAQQFLTVKKTIQKCKSGSKGHKSSRKASSQILSEKSSTSAESKMNDFSDNFTVQGGKTSINKSQKMRFQNLGRQQKGSSGGNKHRISMRQKKKSQLLKMTDQLYI